MIDIKNLLIRIGDFALKDIDLTIEDGEYFVVLGPTGAGKTVLLECIAGLHHIRKGEVWINGNNVTKLAPEERQIGYVPQDYVLFPFLNVFGNIAFGLRRDKNSDANIQERINSLVHIMGISHLLSRDPSSLSGGEKQRVALARALAPSPRILLLDEPLGALDLQTSKRLRLELRRIHGEIGITTIHVTHNQMEAEEISDRIAVMNAGRLEQVGRPREIFFYPRNEKVSEFVGAPNILECEFCRDLGQGLIEGHCAGITLVIPHEGNRVRRIAVFPRDVYISETEPPGPRVNRFKGIITSVEYGTPIVRVGLEMGGNNLVAEVPSNIVETMDLYVGREVFVILKLRRTKVLEE